jgi:triacylglycerol esterase/lipase EstA (alpha/beta hydrolase family)
VRRSSVLALLLLGALTSPSSAARAQDAPYDVPPASLRNALSCPEGFVHGRPVLLVHGTGSTAAESWDRTYTAPLELQGFDVCRVTIPGRTLLDAQVSAEYVAFALTRVARMTGHKVAVIGHSQGNLNIRWALTFWPSARAVVSDFVSLAGDHHGASGADGVCASGSCVPSVWQQRPSSQFLKALNRRPETFPGVATTSIWSETDEIIGPEPDRATATSRLRGAANIVLQDICDRPVGHVQHLTEAPVFALVLDALNHPGPARASRLPSDICLRPLVPGQNPDDVAWANTVSYGQAVAAVETGPTVTSEPPLKPYAR